MTLLNKTPSIGFVTWILSQLKGLNLNGDICSGTWLGDYQRNQVLDILTTKRLALKAARQSGKTFVAALEIVARILMGQRGVIALRTIKQGQGQLTEYVRKMLIHLSNNPEIRHAIRLDKRDSISNQDLIVCPNGGAVRVLSTDEGYKGREGWRGTFIRIDEAHRADVRVYADLSSIINRAILVGNDSIVMFGIGGHRNKLLSHSIRNRGFTEKIYDDTVIVDTYPDYQIIADRLRTELTPDEYDEQVKCLDVAGTSNILLPDIPADLEIPSHYPPEPVYYFGIDLGFSDYTVVIVLAKFLDKMLVVDRLRLKHVEYPQQIEEIYNFIDTYPYMRKNIMVERNAVGRPVWGYLNEKITGIRSYHLGKDKADYCLLLQRMIAKGKLAVVDNELREELSSLIYEFKDGSYKIEHNDSLSALLMAVIAMQETRVL